MYLEIGALSRNSNDELTVLFTKRRFKMESSRQFEETECHDDLLEDFQKEVLDLSTKRSPPVNPDSVSSPSSPFSSSSQLKKRRTMSHSVPKVAFESSHPSVNRIEEPSALVNNNSRKGVATGMRYHTESISPCSVDDDDDPFESSEPEVALRPLSSSDYPSLLRMPPLHAISPATLPLPPPLLTMPSILANHSLNTTAAAVAAAAAAFGINSFLRPISTNCSTPSTPTDARAATPRVPSIPLHAGDQGPVVPPAAYYLQPPRRRRRSSAPRCGRSEAAGSPRLPFRLTDELRGTDDDRSSGSTGRTVSRNSSDRSQAEERDLAYQERRRKNNEAAKRSRDARRQKEEVIAFRAAKLEQENISLKAELLLLRRESAELHHILYGRMDPQR